MPLASLLLIIVVGAWHSSASSVQKAGIRRVVDLNDPAVVGPLAQGLDFGLWGSGDSDREVAKVAAGALIRLLPRLKAPDAALLNDDQRACLRRALGGRRRRDVEMRNRAAECLPVLQDRAEKERIAMTLVRPTSAPAESTLLRPAGASANGDAAILLRAADSGEDPI